MLKRSIFNLILLLALHSFCNGFNPIATTRLYSRFDGCRQNIKAVHRKVESLKMAKKQDDVTSTKKIIRYDNVGDPIYEDETSSGKGGISVFGYSVPFDPLSASLIIFGLIAFNFFVVANL